MARIRKTRTVARGSPDVGQRIDRLVQQLVQLPRAQVTGLLESCTVQVNDALCVFPGYRVEADDRVVVEFDPARRYPPRDRPRRHPGFEIVFEDGHLIVVLKPPELLTVPTRRGERDTLVDRVTHYLRRTSTFAQAHHAQRLDRGVSGLLVFGKTESLAAALRDQFAANKPFRQYVAIVAGTVAADRGTFDSLLATDRDLNRFSTDDAEIGQRAITHYEVVRRLHDTTLVHVWLETGRRNQIRVHFAEAGHPVLGDPRYEARRARHRRWPFERIALHARQLGFRHPATGRLLRFTSPLPIEMERFLAE